MRIADLKMLLQCDVFRYRGGSGWRDFAVAYLREPGFRFTYYLRKVAFYRSTRWTWGFAAYIYNRVLLNHYRFRYGFDISPTAQIGPGLYLGHFGGVVISPFAVIGSNVNVAHGVTIGAESRGRREGAPTIHDRVWIGAHAIIVGKIKIGAEAMIAPGAYVNFDVPEKALVIGNPGKIISSSGSAGYVNRTLDKFPCQPLSPDAPTN